MFLSSKRTEDLETDSQEESLVIAILKKAHLLTDETFALKSKHTDFKLLYDLLIILRDTELLSETNLKAVLNCVGFNEKFISLSIMYNMFDIVNQCELLTQEVLNTVFNDDYALLATFDRTLNYLKQSNLLNKENVQVVLDAKEIIGAFHGYSKLLYKFKLLTQENFDAVLKKLTPNTLDYYFQLIFVLDRLKREKALTKENRDLLLKHSNPEKFAEALILRTHGVTDSMLTYDTKCILRFFEEDPDEIDIQWETDYQKRRLGRR